MKILKYVFLLILLIVSVIIFNMREFSFLLIVLYLLMFCIASISGIVGLFMLVRSKRKKLFFNSISCFAFIFTSTFLGIASNSFFEISAQNKAKEIINAIEEYKRDVGAYPENLTKLQPKYIYKLKTFSLDIVDANIDYALYNNCEYETYRLFYSAPFLFFENKTMYDSLSKEWNTRMD